jgi:hypothetical protein
MPKKENRRFGGFFKEFENNLPGFNYNHRQAYEKTDEEFENKNGFRRYNSYESFKVVKARFFKNRKSR